MQSHVLYPRNNASPIHTWIYVYNTYASQFNIICYAHDVVSDIIIITTVATADRVFYRRKTLVCGHRCS